MQTYNEYFSNAKHIVTDTTLHIPDYADDSHRQDFLKEIDLMKSIGYHTNVVSSFHVFAHMPVVTIFVFGMHC